MATRNRKKRARYTEQFKAEVLRAMETRGTRTIAEVAEGLGVPEPSRTQFKAAVLERQLHVGRRVPACVSA